MIKHKKPVAKHHICQGRLSPPSSVCALQQALFYSSKPDHFPLVEQISKNFITAFKLSAAIIRRKGEPHFYQNEALKDTLYYERPEISAQLIQWHRLRRGGAPRSESKFNDRRGQSHHNITAISRPPTWQIFEQKRIGPVMFRCCQYAMFRHDTAEFHLQIFNIALSAFCADVISPWGK